MREVDLKAPLVAPSIRLHSRQYQYEMQRSKKEGQEDVERDDIRGVETYLVIDTRILISMPFVATFLEILGSP